MARKGQFKKGGGRIGDGRAHHKAKHRHVAMTHRPRTHTVTVTKNRTKYVKVKSKHRGGKHGGGIKLTHLAIAAAGLGYITSDKHGVEFVKTNAAKLPGAATFGVPATIGLYALAVDRYVKPNRWLRLLGYAGLITAAMKVGTEGSDFKVVGDSDVGDYDVGDDD